jgi:hypothetical protein
MKLFEMLCWIPGCVGITRTKLNQYRIWAMGILTPSIGFSVSGKGICLICLSESPKPHSGLTNSVVMEE